MLVDVLLLGFVFINFFYFYSCFRDIFLYFGFVNLEKIKIILSFYCAVLIYIPIFLAYIDRKVNIALKLSLFVAMLLFYVVYGTKSLWFTLLIPIILIVLFRIFAEVMPKLYRLHERRVSYLSRTVNELIFLFISIAVIITIYSFYVYPYIPQQLGGGKPLLVKLYPSDIMNEVLSIGKGQTKYQVIYENGNEIYFLVENRVFKLQKSNLHLIEYLHS